RIGKEVAKRARAFDMAVCAFDLYWDDAFAKQYGVERKETGEEVLRASEVVSLHMNLTEENKEYINLGRIAFTKRGASLLNCARGGLINQADVAAALKQGLLGGYGCDVVEPEPIEKTNPLLAAPNVVFTPHTGSRTYESVERQALMAAESTSRGVAGPPPPAQANKF